MLALRACARIRLHDDPRPALRDAEEPYAYAVLHAHQVCAMMLAEAGTCAMVSRNDDGALVLPMLRIRGVVAMRGSTRKKDRIDRGGASALQEMMTYVSQGHGPAYLAVDGPRGPRGTVHRGIARLALTTGAAVVAVVPVPRRRLVLTKAWDRIQIPDLLTRIDFHFAPPVRALPDESEDALCARIADALASLEAQHDPVEAAAGLEAAERRRKKLELA